MAKRPTRPVVTVGSTQFTFSDQPRDTLSRRAAARPLPQERTKPRSVQARRSWRPTNGALAWIVATLAVTGAGFVWGWVAAVCVLALLGAAVGLRSGWITFLIQRHLKSRGIDELHRLEIAQRGKCSTPRCPWPRAVTDKCTRCESDEYNAKHNPVVIKHRCIDGQERPFSASGSCGGPCPTSLAGRRRAGSRKPRSVVARGG